MFGFIGRRGRVAEAKQRLDRVRFDGKGAQLEAIAPLEAKDARIHELAKKLIEAGNVDRVFKLFEAA
jgi:hypothetical protein